MNTSKLVLLIGGLLIVFGLFKPNLSLLIPSNGPISVDVLELAEPKEENIKKEAEEVLSLMKKSGDKNDSKKLRDLYIDLATLVSLDGEEEVLKNTDEIRQANSIAGLMLRLDIKGKYPDLAKETNDVIVSAIGDDSIVLSKELRAKAVDGFNALAWALNEARK